MRWSSGVSGMLTGAMVLLLAGATIIIAPWPITVVDGDTVDRWPWRHRLVGFDAPEIRRAKCPAEKAKALAAKERLAEIVASAQRVDLIHVKGRDPYGRALSRMVVDGRELSDIALAEGWGIAYAGRGTRHNWCGE